MESGWNEDKETVGFMKCYVCVHIIDHLFLFIETTLWYFSFGNKLNLCCGDSPLFVQFLWLTVRIIYTFTQIYVMDLVVLLDETVWRNNSCFSPISHTPPPFVDSLKMEDCFSVILDGYGYITVKGPLYLLRQQ